MFSPQQYENLMPGIGPGPTPVSTHRLQLVLRLYRRRDLPCQHNGPAHFTTRETSHACSEFIASIPTPNGHEVIRGAEMRYVLLLLATSRYNGLRGRPAGDDFLQEHDPWLSRRQWPNEVGLPHRLYTFRRYTSSSAASLDLFPVC